MFFNEQEFSMQFSNVSRGEGKKFKGNKVHNYELSEKTSPVIHDGEGNEDVLCIMYNVTEGSTEPQNELLEINELDRYL